MQQNQSLNIFDEINLESLNEPFSPPSGPKMYLGIEQKLKFENKQQEGEEIAQSYMINTMS